MSADGNAAFAALLEDGDRLAHLWRLRSSDRLSYERALAELRAVVPGLPVARLEAVLDSFDGLAPRAPEPIPAADAAGTDVWFARWLVSEYGDRMRWIGDWRRWAAYDGKCGRWVEDDGPVWRAAVAVARRLLDDALVDLKQAVERGSKDGEGAARSRVQVARRYHGRGALGAAIDLAAKIDSVQGDPDEFDAEPGLLAVGGCEVVDLRTGAARPAELRDRLMRGTDVRYDRTAEAPMWESFLARVLPDAEVRGFVQRLAGYLAYGDVREHVFPIFHGYSGSNGKSTFLETIAHVLGDCATIVPVSLLLHQKTESHPTELALLYRRRFVYCSEAPDGGRLAAERVKMICGGDRISCRRMREDFWEFRPTHKAVLATNYRPKVSGSDPALWRRVLLVPWVVSIPEDERDNDLKAKLRDGEATGILRWIVEGAIEYLASGLRPPESVRIATADYRDGEDILGQFVADATVETEGGFVASADLHARYAEWSAGQGIERPWGQRTLSAKFRDMGWKYATIGGVRGFRGRTLRERTEPAPSNGHWTSSDGEARW